MHQTTVRFGSDLWEALESECAQLGVSAAQYLREAALARLAYTAGRRGDPAYEESLVAAGAPSSTLSGGLPMAAAERASTSSAAMRDGSQAVSAQSSLVHQRAREIRDRSRALREQVRQTRGREDDRSLA